MFLLVNLRRYFPAEERQRANLGCLENTNQKVFQVNFEKNENIRFLNEKSQSTKLIANLDFLNHMFIKLIVLPWNNKVCSLAPGHKT